MKYLLVIAAILICIVILRFQGCGVLDGMRERQQQRQQQRKENRQNRIDNRKERKQQRIDNRRFVPRNDPYEEKQKRFMDNYRRFGRRNRRRQ